MDIKKAFRYLSIVFLSGFGLLTLFLSSAVIFDLFEIRAKQGNYVLFIVWTNFICSFLYLFSAYGFLKVKSWTSVLLRIASVILIISFVLLKIHISKGGLYETKTYNAMIFRIIVTIVFTLIASFTITNKQKTIS